MARREPDAIRITSATRSRGEDISSRQRRYLVSMGVRTVCFILAIVFAGEVLMWVFIAASFVLPYVAVVAANAGSTTDHGGPEPVGPDMSRPAIEAPPPSPRPGD